ncbi:uncharacterized protein M421DRAFT_91186 [Didymella exigua CBS 183.55]|uniref:Uncharacterized protein n=1 Tax=Didymella exigua CBS 183.55 TaxID=1150837 RepID=A0A6A5RSB2_9PLEO|nr:uncharacterized protein M421DRAFT_91186 [Didymella exigua CBS 183.55]KAF1929974.1 hypothetical protein M421DRAFT_91186 [Didymella exigua CBS 183.55]
MTRAECLVEMYIAWDAIPAVPGPWLSARSIRSDIDSLLVGLSGRGSRFGVPSALDSCAGPLHAYRTAHCSAKDTMRQGSITKRRLPNRHKVCYNRRPCGHVGDMPAVVVWTGICLDVRAVVSVPVQSRSLHLFLHRNSRNEYHAPQYFSRVLTAQGYCAVHLPKLHHQDALYNYNIKRRR